MLIAFADSHRHPFALEEMAAIIQREKAQVFAHAGDNYVDYQRLQKRAPIPGYGVRGNCDPLLLAGAPEEQVFDYEGYKYFLTHGHKYGVKYSTDNLLKKAKSIGAQVVIFGHSHMPLITVEEEILLVNPGSISYPRSGSSAGYARIYLEKGSIKAEIVKL